MKNSKICPKCGSTDLVRVDLSGGITVGFVTLANLERWVCCNCGFTEEWVRDSAELERVKLVWREE